MLAPLVPYDRFALTRRLSDDKVRTEFVAGEALDGMGAGRIGDASLSVTNPKLRNADGVLVADTSVPPEGNDPVWDRFTALGFKSWMETSLGTNAEPIGYLSVRSKTPNAYPSEVADFFMQVGRQLGPAIRNAQYSRNLKEMALREAAISRIGRIVSSTLDFDTVWEEFVRQLQRIIPADRIVVTHYLPDEDRIIDTHVWGVRVDKWEKGKTHSAKESPSVRVAHLGKAIYEDLGGDAVLSSPHHFKAGLKSGMYAPLFHMGEVIGTLNVKSRQPNAYSRRDLPLLQTLADQIAGAIASARLHAESLEAANLRESQITLEANNQRLENESFFKSSLISTVSHELRTPLTGIVAMTDVLYKNKPGTLNERQMDQLQVVRKSAKMLFLLTNDLLTASSVEAGKLEVRPEVVDVESLFAGLEQSLSAIFSEKKQLLLVECEPGLEVTADRIRLEQMVANILSNASKYSPEGTMITLDGRQDGARILISVTDEGDGISEENLEQVFKTYFRSDDSATRSADGTGIGLYIVKTLADAHNGKISVKSEIGIGSTFTIELPVIALESQVADAA